MKMIPFVKAHACGNDFLVIQEQFLREQEEFPRESAQKDLARRLCRRNDGIGADGIEFFRRLPDGTGKIRLFNADGSIAEISGNGTRCVAAWIAYENNLGSGEEIPLETDAGLRICRVVSREQNRFAILSAMGVPSIHPHSVALADGTKVQGAAVSTGNPHFVVFVENSEFEVAGRTWQSLGSEISRHPAFPLQTNVEFVRCLSPGEIEIRIYERGVGPTTSSGTGTCASASAAMRLLGADRELRISAPGGAQTVHWKDDGSQMLLTGPAELICFGEAC